MHIISSSHALLHLTPPFTKPFCEMLLGFILRKFLGMWYIATSALHKLQIMIEAPHGGNIGLV